MEDFNERKKIGSGLNVHGLVMDGWNPTFFDAEFENPQINLYKRVLTPETIGDDFRELGIPLDVDYVSIDVDSIDIWLFNGLLKSGYRPRVISVEYNPNFPINVHLTCEKKWAPWRERSRIYGSSASALNMVARIHGYRVVEIISGLDMFFIRVDILEKLCAPESLPSYEFLAKGFVGVPAHKHCTADQVQRLVDFPLSLEGNELRAKEKAVADVEGMNRFFLEKFGKPFCRYTGT